MMAVSNTQKLQQLFGQAAAGSGNAYSRQVFSRLHHCHTAANGSHTYRCNEANEQGLAMLGDLENVKPGTKAQ